MTEHDSWPSGYRHREGDLELRVNGPMHYTRLEIVKWGIDSCWTVALWEEAKGGPREMRFIGDRPFDCDGETFWRLAREGQEIAARERHAQSFQPTYVGQTEHEPPFDPGLPCPFCPSVVRNYFAIAHNAALAIASALNGGAEWSRARRKLAELLKATKDVQPLVDAHFAHDAHAHGPRTSAGE